MQNIRLNKTSYIMDFGSTVNAATKMVNSLMKLETKSDISTSYNSIVMMHVESSDGDRRNNKHYEYNYLMYIDDTGVGYPLNTLISNSVVNDDLSAPKIICITPVIEPTTTTATALENEALIATIDAQNGQITELSDALISIINILNNSSVKASLGITNNINLNAAINSASEKVNKVLSETAESKISKYASANTDLNTDKWSSLSGNSVGTFE